MRRAFALAALLAPLLACAGTQDEEKLSDSVRASLQAAIADRAVPVLLFKSGAHNAHQWLSEMSKRLEQRIPDRKERIELLKTVNGLANVNGCGKMRETITRPVEHGDRDTIPCEHLRGEVPNGTSPDDRSSPTLRTNPESPESAEDHRERLRKTCST